MSIEQLRYFRVSQHYKVKLSDLQKLPRIFKTTLWLKEYNDFDRKLFLWLNW